MYLITLMARRSPHVQLIRPLSSGTTKRRQYSKLFKDMNTRFPQWNSYRQGVTFLFHVLGTKPSKSGTQALATACRHSVKVIQIGSEKLASTPRGPCLPQPQKTSQLSYGAWRRSNKNRSRVIASWLCYGNTTIRSIVSAGRTWKPTTLLICLTIIAIT